MIVEKVQVSEINRLFSELDKRMQSMKRRNVSYQITAHGRDCATIVISVSGRQGIISKNITLVHKGEWNLYYDGYVGILDGGFNEITSVVKRIVTQTTTIVSKL